MQRPGLNVETSHLIRRPSFDSSRSSPGPSPTSVTPHPPPKPRRRAMGVGRRRDVVLLCTVALGLVIFRLGVDLSAVHGPTVSPHRFTDLKRWPEALGGDGTKKADQGRIDFWPPDTAEDIAKPRCIQYNLRSQCVEFAAPEGVDGTIGPDAETVERQRREQEELNRLSTEARDFVRSTRWLARDWPVNLRWNEASALLAGRADRGRCASSSPAPSGRPSSSTARSSCRPTSTCGCGCHSSGQADRAGLLVRSVRRNACR